ncbi:MAG: SpoIIE family protein phosphatase [Campylobacterota bacterium]|nr:SpoIIE family protein phosphatase [Campylobacterota bacterium]
MFQNTYSEKKLKLLRLVIVLSFIYSSALALLDSFGITQYIEYRTPLMIVYAICNAILYFIIKRSENYNTVILNIVLALALVVFTTTIVIYPKSEIRFMWYFFTIMIAYYVGGQKVGNIVAIISAIIVIFICSIFHLDFNSTTISSILLGILFISQISNYFVNILNENEKKLYEYQDSLQGMIDKLVINEQNLTNAKKEIELAHKHTRESIEYASLIQGALIPEQELFSKYFKDYFIHWLPKDTVGGDIYLFDELRHDDECLLFFIDCTGHGVPGAFVTMIVKSIEREIVSKIKDNEELEVSPAWIMKYFNRTMKILLKQDNDESRSNAGWDGGIIYYNKKDKILKFAGAETPLFYVDNNSKLNKIKGNRYSVGYKKCDMDYRYKETILNVENGMKFYCTTDGYLDQNGGEKDFPFGKKRFSEIIKLNHNKNMEQQKEIFIKAMDSYESMIENNDRNDDMTVIVFEV